MNMQKNQNSFHKLKINEAFTYIEVIVSLIIISLIACLLYFSYSICIKGFNSSRESVTDSLIHISVDSYFREKIQTVTIPYWLYDYEYTFTDSEIMLSWMNGEKKLDKVTVPKNVKIDDIRVIFSENKNIKGLHIKYFIKSKEYETKVLFASRVFGDLQI